MSLHGLKTFNFPPPTTADNVWHRVDAKGHGIVFVSGVRHTYSVRFLLTGRAPLEYHGPLHDGLMIPVEFDALEFQFGDTASAPAAANIVFLVSERRNFVFSASEPHPDAQRLRVVANTNGSPVAVGAASGSVIFDDALDTIFLPSEFRPHTFRDQHRADCWLHGHIGAHNGAFEVWLLAYANVNNPHSTEPVALYKWDSLALTPPAGVHSDANQWGWQAGHQNAGGTIFQGGVRWPVGGGKLVVYNAGGAGINISYNLALTSQY